MTTPEARNGTGTPHRSVSTTDSGNEPALRSDSARRRGSVVFTVVGILGELLITVGVFVFMFLGWQLWLNDIIVGNSQRDDALALSQSFSGHRKPASSGSPSVRPTPSAVDPSPSAASTPPAVFGEPVVSVEPAETKKFATIYVPRFGADYVRTIAEGVSAANVLKTGVGHYPGTQMPGEVGNFALAGHRTTYGAPFHQINTLQVGDKIYVQTTDGWYTYVFRSLEYVPPNGIGVLDPVPQSTGVTATSRLLTMTSCNPLLSAAERIIAYSVFDSWQPTSAGPPGAIKSLADKQA